MPERTEQRRDELAERIINQLKAGVIPWQKDGLPHSAAMNALSGRSYKGVNTLYLMDRCAENGYSDNRWLTLSDIQKQGIFIKKGEHGVVLEHWYEKDGKMAVRGYPVFNVSQLKDYMPLPEAGREKGKKEFEDMDYPGKIKELVSKAVDKNCENVHTEELKALRSSMAAAMVCQEMGVDYGAVPEQENLAESWAKSIRSNPRELFRAARDAGKVADMVLQDMERERNGTELGTVRNSMKEYREAQLQEAAAQKAEAQRAEELLSGAASIPRGADYNLPNADLSPEQEAVMSSISKAHTEITDMRAAATEKEAANTPSPVAAAIQSAKQKMGPSSFVTNALTGRTYRGEILEIAGKYPDTAAIQRIAGNQAVLHRIKDISANTNISVGADLSITKEKNGKITVKAMSEIEKAEREQAQSISERERDR